MRVSLLDICWVWMAIYVQIQLFCIEAHAFFLWRHFWYPCMEASTHICMEATIQWLQLLSFHWHWPSSVDSRKHNYGGCRLLESWPIPVCINPVWCTLSVPAQIVIRPNQTSAVDAGNTVTFVCVASGDPNPSISWNRGETVLSNDSRVTIYEDLVTENETTFVQSILELSSAEEADAGQYSCFAANTLGNDTASFVLTVNTQSKQHYEWNHSYRTFYY